MKKILLYSILLLPLTVQCQNSLNTTPKWVNNPPKSKDKIYAVGVGTSSSPDVAERKAIMDANVNLAENVRPAVVTITSHIDSIIQGNEILIERVNIIRKKVEATLQNTQLINKTVLEEKGKYKVYVLVEMPKKEINRSVISYVDEDKELYNAIAKTKTYKRIAREAK
jgi:hypothetical protein